MPNYYNNPNFYYSLLLDFEQWCHKILMNINEEYWTFSNNCNKQDFVNFYDFFFIPFALFDVVFIVVLMRIWLCWGLTSQSTIFQSYRDGAIASTHENEVYSMYVFLSTLGSPEIGFLHFYCVLNSTHEYFCEVLRTYSSTFIKWVLSTYSSTFQATSTQYLLKYWSSVLAPCLVITNINTTGN